jgi:hypothetical protein
MRRIILLLTVIALGGCQANYTAGRYGRIDGQSILGDPQRLRQAEADKAMCKAYAVQATNGSGPAVVVNQSVSINVNPQPLSRGEQFSNGFANGMRVGTANRQRNESLSASYEGCMAQKGYYKASDS